MGRKPVAFVAADAHALPLATSSVDGCRCERTLQHVDDPAAAVAEMARVLRQGGLLALTEPDWETCVVGGGASEVARVVVHNWLTRNRNPTVGRQLAGLVKASGLLLRELDGVAVCYRTFDEADRVFPLRRAAAQATADGLLSERDAAGWIADLDAASSMGAFLLSVTLFSVVARRP